MKVWNIYSLARIDTNKTRRL